MTAATNFRIPKSGRDYDIAKVSRFLAACLPGKRLRVTVEEAKPERSNLQNRALWGVAYKALEDQTGNEPEDLHVYFSGEFFGWVEYEVMGQRKKRPRRTTTTDESGKRRVMATMDFIEFYNFIQRRSAEGGFYVPDPDPFWFEAEDHEEREAA